MKQQIQENQNLEDEIKPKIKKSVTKKPMKPQRSMKKLRSVLPKKIRKRRDLFHKSFWE